MTSEQRSHYEALLTLLSSSYFLKESGRLCGWKIFGKKKIFESVYFGIFCSRSLTPYRFFLFFFLHIFLAFCVSFLFKLFFKILILELNCTWTTKTCTHIKKKLIWLWSESENIQTFYFTFETVIMINNTTLFKSKYQAWK